MKRACKQKEGARAIRAKPLPASAGRDRRQHQTTLRSDHRIWPLRNSRPVSGNNTNVAIWNDVGAQTTDTRAGAQWALDLHRAGRIWLSPREIDFLVSSTTWQGGLTAKMAAWLRSILDRAVAATGCVPPS